mgnify:CR=1 FL=1
MVICILFDWLLTSCASKLVDELHKSWISTTGCSVLSKFTKTGSVNVIAQFHEPIARKKFMGLQNQKTLYVYSIARGFFHSSLPFLFILLKSDCLVLLRLPSRDYPPYSRLPRIKDVNWMAEKNLNINFPHTQL